MINQVSPGRRRFCYTVVLLLYRRRSLLPSLDCDLLSDPCTAPTGTPVSCCPPPLSNALQPLGCLCRRPDQSGLNRSSSQLVALGRLPCLLAAALAARRNRVTCSTLEARSPQPAARSPQPATTTSLPPPVIAMIAVVAVI